MDNQTLITVVINGTITAILEAAVQLDQRRRLPISRSQVDEPDPDRGSRWVAEVLADDAQLLVESRLRRPVFEELAGYLRAHRIADSRYASAEERLLVFLYICGNRASYRNVIYRCGRLLETISRLA